MFGYNLIPSPPSSSSVACAGGGIFRKFIGMPVAHFFAGSDCCASKRSCFLSSGSAFGLSWKALCDGGRNVEAIDCGGAPLPAGVNLLG
jgi:hypothetical protein